ncbi:venom protease-like isoform X2 [Portunus trituberculatus]|uniref:venom protease-like isoform X2 n=1 Tax=Portunus trituberculatus TaxID=210409 RepID=UPI001E1D1926|nr:venom protease-like isoform X2 [Portunus trituberculatus]
MAELRWQQSTLSEDMRQRGKQSRREDRMERVCALVLLMMLSQATEASAIIFPGQLDHAEGDDCPTSSGGPGKCSRSCEHSVGPGEPSRCGIKDSAFLVCCDIPSKCGKNVQNFLNSRGPSRGNVLRPEPPTPPSPIIEIAASRPARSAPGGFVPSGGRSETAEGIGGVNTKSAWPWMTLLGETSNAGIRWFCGGVLINEQWILSALHCFFHNSADVVRLGEHNYNDDNDGAIHEDFGVTETVLYPDFTFGEGYHDLALLKLDKPVAVQEFISPVCLPWGTESDSDVAFRSATLTGWGDTERGGFPTSILQEISVTVFPSAMCNDSYSTLRNFEDTWPRGIGDEILCAGDLNGGRDACQGDSGGPLVTEEANGLFVLAGIVSQGYGCGHKDYPGLYVNIRHKAYLAWIKKVAFTSP